MELRGTAEVEGVSWAVPETTHWKLKQDCEVSHKGLAFVILTCLKKTFGELTEESRSRCP